MIELIMVVLSVPRTNVESEICFMAHAKNVEPQRFVSMLAGASIFAESCFYNIV